MMSELIIVRVTDVRSLCEGIVGVEMARRDGGALPAFAAGAHIALHLPNGLVRQYSLYGSPDDTSTYKVAVLKQMQGRGGSVYVHDALRPGVDLGIEAPRNLFPLVAAGHSVLIAGGIGITPILAMANQLHKDGRSFELLYLTRARATTAFVAELASAPYAGRVTIHHDEESGRMFDIAAALAKAPAGSQVYCCGPAPLMDAVRNIGTSFPPQSLHFEAFAADEIKQQGDRGFDVILARSKRKLAVTASETILEVLIREGVDVDFSCQEGTCGTCIVRVLEGEPDHRDTVLSESERAANDQMLVCCSRSKRDRLTLDL